MSCNNFILPIRVACMIKDFTLCNVSGNLSRNIEYRVYVGFLILRDKLQESCYTARCQKKFIAALKRCESYSGQASVKIWSRYANFKSWSLFISKQIHCFYGLWTRNISIAWPNCRAGDKNAVWLKAMLHDAIFLATCNAAVIVNDVKLANTRF